MFLNLAVVVFVLLIGYWWANQGLFSAIIHLVCVIVAGALALAFWEPFAYGLLMRGSFFDPYAVGAGLLIPFVVALVILRLTTNKLVPANVLLPKWANLSLGYPVGLASGVLTIGLLLIGLGMMQSDRSLLGFVGYGRANAGKVAQISSLWLPVHQLTDAFYSRLSVGALSTSQPLRHYNPQLYQQSASLLRDSFRGGRGQVTMRPSQASVEWVRVCPKKCVVMVRFKRGAQDYGTQLTVSGSQIRLIATGSGTATPHVAFPERWRQEISDGGQHIFRFDDKSHYVTTIPGRELADMLFEFPWPEGLLPQFIQIKNARLELKQIQSMPSCNRVMRDGGRTRAAATDFTGKRLLVASAGGPRGGGISVSDSTVPVMTNTNRLPSSMKEQDKKLLEGFAVFGRERSFVGPALRIDKFFETIGTRIVQVDVSRGQPGSIFSKAAGKAAPDAVAMLVDSKGNTYSAIGYVHERTDGVEIRLYPADGLSADLIPHLPTSGSQKLRLIFQVTLNSRIVGFQLGDMPLARCNILVRERQG